MSTDHLARRALVDTAYSLAFAANPSQALYLQVILNLEKVIGEIAGKKCQLVAIFEENEAPPRPPLPGQISLIDLLEGGK